MKYYKGAKPRKDDAGSFKHDNRTKPGKHGAISAKPAKEKLGKADPVHAKLRKISKAMFQRRKATGNDAMMRAQLNA